MCGCDGVGVGVTKFMWLWQSSCGYGKVHVVMTNFVTNGQVGREWCDNNLELGQSWSANVTGCYGM